MQDPPPPRLSVLFLCFLSIGMQSFGGGLAAWIRREVVQRRRWMADPPFLSGLAVSQIAPGANAVNLAVFIGATLRGTPGALAALSGLLLLPIAVVLLLGFAYARVHNVPGMETVLAGMGAVAIGLNLATGIRLTRRNVSDIPGALLMAATAISVGLLRVKLLVALAVLIPLSLLHETLRARRARTRP